jgi:signal transduction histidine kinase/DNA-binding response OmpR family regulator
MAKGKILVIDDNWALQQALADILQDAGYQVELAADGQGGLELAAKGDFDVALVDIHLPDLGGMEVLRALQEIDEDLKALIMTGQPSSETAIQAVRLGAFDYLLKPMDSERLLIQVQNALAARQLVLENRQLLHDLQHSNAELRQSNRRLATAREETESLNVTLQHTLNEVAALQGVVSTISGQQSLDAVLAQILQTITDYLDIGFHMGGFLLAHPGEERMIFRVMRPVGHRFLQETEERLVQGFQALTGRAVLQDVRTVITQEGVSILLEDTRGVGSFVTLPLFMGQQVKGMFVLTSLQPEAFTTNAIRMSAIVGGQAAVAVENARLFDKTQRDLMEKQALLELSRGMAQVLELEEVLHLVVEAPMKTVPRAQQCVVHLLDEEGETLHPAAYAGLQPSDGPGEGKGIPPGEGIVGLAFQKRETVCVGDMVKDPRCPPPSSQGRFRSLLVTPLITGGRSLGTLSVCSHAVDAFTPDDVRLLETMAAQAAVVLENARLYSEVLSNERRMEAVIANMADGLVILDDQDRVLTLNRAAEWMLSLPAEQVLGRRVTGDSGSPHLRTLASLCPGQEPSSPSSSAEADPAAVRLHATVREVSLDESLDRILQVYTSPVRDDEGHFWGRVLVLHDVTRERQLDQLKEEFVSSVSHELRTPLQSIKGFVELLRKGKVKDPVVQQEFLTRAAQDADRLMVLVNDLLDMSRIEAGRLQLELTDVDMSALIAETLQSLEGLAGEKGVSVTYTSSDTPVMVRADRHRLQQVLVNLVGNAIKFTDAHRSIQVVEEVGNRHVMIEVADQGSGIPAEALPRLFEKFYQAESSAKRAGRGTGLGLYISKRIIEAHGGRIDVRSEPGRGSTFFFVLPRQRHSDVPNQGCLPSP